MNGKSLFVNLVALSLFISLSFVMFGGDAQEPVKGKESKKEKAIKVLKISGAVQTYVDALLEGIKQSPMTFEDKALYSELANPESLMDYFVPVYIEKYTDEELDAMIDFYSSRMGQSIVSKSLPVVIELRKASMQWGMRISEKVKSEKARISAGKDK